MNDGNDCSESSALARLPARSQSKNSSETQKNDELGKKGDESGRGMGGKAESKAVRLKTVRLLGRCRGAEDKSLTTNDTNNTKGSIGNQLPAFPVRDVRVVRGYLPPLQLNKKPASLFRKTGL